MDKELKKLNDGILEITKQFKNNSEDKKTIIDKLTRIERHLVRIDNKIKKIK
jgi:hypothetical protein